MRLYDLVVAMTRGGPGIASEVPAKFVMDHLFERNNIGLGDGGCDGHAGHRRCRSWRRGSTRRYVPAAGEAGMTARRARRAAARAGSPPAASASTLSSSRPALFFLLPLWIMVVTSLKPMDEIRLGNILAWPAALTFEPWIKAWSSACTGSNATASASASGTRCGS